MGIALWADPVSANRPSEADLLGVSGLDEETQRALFPSIPLPNALAEGSVWKWSDIGTAPALHQFAQHSHNSPATLAIGNTPAVSGGSHAATQPGPTKHSTAAKGHLTEHQGRSKLNTRRSSPNGSCNRNPSPSPDPEHYLVGLRWGAQRATPGHPPGPPSQIEAHNFGSNKSPSPPRFVTSCHHGVRPPAGPWRQSSDPLQGHPSQSPCAQLQSDGCASAGLTSTEGRFRSASPSVARACVTLPGFSSPRQPAPADHVPIRDQHSSAPNITAGKHKLNVLTVECAQCTQA